MLYVDEQKARGRPEHSLGEVRKSGFCKEKTWHWHKDGGLFAARNAPTALGDQSGGLVGFSKVGVELTAHKRLERCVRQRADAQRTLHTANAGMWTWHPATGRMHVCANLMCLPGHASSDTSMTLGDWRGFVDPGDRLRGVENFLPSEPAVSARRW